MFHFVVGRREVIGDCLWQHPGIDGVVFTGSKTVGLRIYHGIFDARWIKPCLMELGGKNPALVMPSRRTSRPPRKGVMRSAFGLQNQKCSATSRVYVHRRRRPDRSSSGCWSKPAAIRLAIRPRATSTSVR